MADRYDVRLASIGIVRDARRSIVGSSKTYRVLNGNVRKSSVDSTVGRIEKPVEPRSIARRTFIVIERSLVGACFTDRPGRSTSSHNGRAIVSMVIFEALPHSRVLYILNGARRAKPRSLRRNAVYVWRRKGAPPETGKIKIKPHKSLYCASRPPQGFILLKYEIHTRDRRSCRIHMRTVNRRRR